MMEGITGRHTSPPNSLKNAHLCDQFSSSYPLERAARLPLFVCRKWSNFQDKWQMATRFQISQHWTTWPQWRVTASISSSIFYSSIRQHEDKYSGPYFLQSFFEDDPYLREFTRTHSLSNTKCPYKSQIWV